MKKEIKVLDILAEGNIGGVEILCRNYLSCTNLEHHILFLWDTGKIAQEIKENCQNVMFGNFRHFELIKMFIYISKYCAENRIDVVIAHHSVSAIHACFILLRIFNPSVKTIFYAQSDADRIISCNRKVLQTFHSAILSYSYRKCDEVIAISNYVKNSLIRVFGERKKNPIVLYNGTLLNNSNKLHNSHSPLIITYVGRLIEEKGVQRIIRSLVKINYDYIFRIVGDGPYKEELEKLSVALNINDKVEFLGYRRDVENLLLESDIFVHFPLCQEGFGLSVVEAMSKGLVCVVGNKGALPEIITDAKDGYIVDGDENIIAEKVNKILMNYNSEEICKIRIAAIKKSKEYSIEKYSEKLDSIIEGML